MEREKDKGMCKEERRSGKKRRKEIDAMINYCTWLELLYICWCGVGGITNTKEKKIHGV